MRGSERIVGYAVSTGACLDGAFVFKVDRAMVNQSLRGELVERVGGQVNAMVKAEGEKLVRVVGALEHPVEVRRVVGEFVVQEDHRGHAEC